LTQKNVTGIVKVNRLEEIQVELKGLQMRLELLTSMYESYLRTFRHLHRTDAGNLYKFLTLDETKTLNRTSDKLSELKKVIKSLCEESRSTSHQIYRIK
jgi:hypothetical protein